MLAEFFQTLATQVFTLRALGAGFWCAAPEFFCSRLYDSLLLQPLDSSMGELSADNRMIEVRFFVEGQIGR